MASRAQLQAALVHMAAAHSQLLATLDTEQAHRQAVSTANGFLHAELVNALAALRPG